MAENLIKAVQALQITNRVPPESEEEADAFLFNHRPRKKKKTSLAEIKNKLESSFLKPDTDFSQEWLNKLQQ